MKVKLKICGMKYSNNILDVARLQPDYLGFIFYEKSKRNFEGEIPEISNTIKKTGVFVNATSDFILEKVKKHHLKAIQLHGDESADFCKKLQQNNLEVIKVFSVGETFNFTCITAYENVCDYFLFDTKGKERGGNGTVFNWRLLKKYPSKKPFFLSGGIGLETIKNLQNFFKSSAATYCYAIDVNSKFEAEPGLKNTEDLKELIKALK